MAEQFQRAGLAAAAIDAATPSDVRTRILRQLRSGEINTVFAVDALTEGVDIPQVDTILLLHPPRAQPCFCSNSAAGSACIATRTCAPCSTLSANSTDGFDLT
ncbi:MAG: helicase-related protein [Planctomycetota bacterium]